MSPFAAPQVVKQCVSTDGVEPNLNLKPYGPNQVLILLLCVTLCCSPFAALQVVKQCVGTEGVEPEYIKTEVLPEFFKCFWNRRMALDR